MRSNKRKPQRSCIKFKHLCNPKMVIIGLLVVCWNLRNSVAIGIYDGQGRPYHPNANSHHNHQSRSGSNIRLRAPPSYHQMTDIQPFEGAGIALSDETAIIGNVIRSSPDFTERQEQEQFAGFDEMSPPRRKKNCGEPSIATRGLLGPTLKRSYFAFTQNEVDEKVRDDEYRDQTASERNKRDVGFPLQKRSGGAEVADTVLPWTCETKYEWKDMGADHYPRFVRTAECKTRYCFNGFFRCKPRRYKTKVLKRISPSDSTSCEDDDVSLPETLRSDWKFITVTINLCCDCTGRIPGNADA